MQSRLPRGMAPSAVTARILGSASPADGAPTACDGLKEGQKKKQETLGLALRVPWTWSGPTVRGGQDPSPLPEGTGSPFSRLGTVPQPITPRPHQLPPKSPLL